MPGMDADIQAALNELDSLGWWYQHFQLPNGLWTGDGSAPSYLPQRRWEMIEPFVPADLAVKTVLDLGGNAGYFSIQMKIRGAARCVLVDPFPEFVRQADFAARQSHVKIELVCEDAHTYCLTTEERFDYILLLGLLYHLKYPGLVLDRTAEMTKERMFVATAVIGPEVEGPAMKQNYERLTDVQGGNAITWPDDSSWKRYWRGRRCWPWPAWFLRVSTWGLHRSNNNGCRRGGRWISLKKARNTRTRGPVNCERVPRNGVTAPCSHA